jgi:HD superfamily phosphohydrolase YqeK
MGMTLARSRAGLNLYIFATATIAVIFAVVSPWDPTIPDPTRFQNALIALLALSVLSEASSVSLRLSGATSSVAFVPFLAAVYLLGPSWAMLIGGVTFTAVEAFVRRKPLIKVLFNTSKEVIALGVAGFLFVSFGGVPSLEFFQLASVIDVIPFGVAILGYFTVGHVAVCRAVSLAERISFPDAWVRIGGGSVIYDLFASMLAPLLAYVYVERQLAGLALLIVPLFFVRHLFHMFRQLEQVNRELLELMVKSIEARDPYTSGHSQRVAKYARLIGHELALPGKAVEEVATAGLLHDVGKIYEEFAVVLRKEGRLSAEERVLMESHPARSAELIATVTGLRGRVEKAVQHHHENWDGGGYPAGLAGEEIPLPARIIMIADTIDAMTTDRPYRKALSFERVVEELVKYSGRQFDPQLVQTVIHSASLRALLVERTHESPPASQIPALRNLLIRGRSWRRRTAGGGWLAS